MISIKKGLRSIYQNLGYFVLSVNIFLLFSLLDYVLLTRTTSLGQFIADNHPVFVFLSFILGFFNNLFISIVLTGLVYVVEKRKKALRSAGVNSLTGVFLSLISVGCAVCGGFLLPIFGVAASLTAFPFQGLEIKILSIIVLIFSFYQLALILAGNFKEGKNKWLKYSMVAILSILITYLIPRLPWGWRQNFFGNLMKKEKIASTDKTRDNLFDQINPVDGYQINASYDDLGPKMIEAGVIDLEKFKKTYEENGQPLTEEQLKILTKGSNEKIKITRENSYFLLNFFWAAGLANQSRILTEGDMVKYGADQIGNFASTGGWSLAKSQPMDYYAKFSLIPLTSDQEKLVEKIASNIYRPCCNNSTAFPDCNHGMALLAVLQLLAKNGTTENQMYEAAKYFNAFWFPGNYYDLALYFKNKEGKDFSQVPGQIILGKDYSSASGWQKIKQWLTDKGLIQQPPRQGGGCGV